MKHIINHISSCIISLFFAAFSIFAVSCGKSSNTPTYDVTDATVSSFVLMDNDSAPDLSSAKFIIEDLADTGSIHLADKDSIHFGYSIKRVRPAVKYNSVPSAAIWYVGDTSYVATGYDTLDFTLSPVYLRVYASDRKHEKWYRIHTRVHLVDPDKYVWWQPVAQITTPRSAEQHALLAGSGFFFFTNDGQNTLLHTSSTAAEWQQHAVTGLPADCHVRQIVYDSLSTQFCYIAGTQVYTSADAMSWNTDFTGVWDNSWTCISTLMSFDDKVWTIVSDTDKSLRLATIDLKNKTFNLQWEVNPADFPVSDFAVTPFPGSSDRRHCLVAGGYALDGHMTAGFYAFEAAPTGCRMVKLDNADTSQQPFAGAAIVWYGKQLLWYGGLDDSQQLFSYPRYSPTQGMTWTDNTDTLHSPQPPLFGKRWRISAFTQGDYIWLIGGQGNTSFFTDIYRGRLNSVDW